MAVASPVSARPDELAPVVEAKRARFARFAWWVLGYTILAVLWGAFVRSSISGDGCGTNWPLCDGGSLLPHVQGLEKLSLRDLWAKLSDPVAYAQADALRAELTRKLVEFSHRLSTIPLTLGVVVMFFWGRRLFPKGHAVRYAVGVAVLFIVVESLIGAVLVKKGLVTNDASALRAVMMPVHLINTFILLSGLALAAWFAAGNEAVRLRGQGPVGFSILAAFVFYIVLCITGSLSALGGMVYQFESHEEVLRAIENRNAPFLIAAKPTHPYTSAVVAMLLSLIVGLVAHLRPSPNTRRFATATWLLLGAQMVAGLVNIYLMAPPWMQIVHLFLADLLWIVLVLLGAAACAVSVPHVEMAHVPEAVLDGQRAGIKDYVALTKPRVISLLLLTTLTAMFIAAQGWPGESFLHGLWLLIATGTGLYAAAGASNAINMVCERDLDVRMKRTASRPTVTEKVHPRAALWFAFGLEAFSFGLLWWSSNLLAATMALSGLVVYVVVYTLLLKRRTWSNIVIGGAAGAFPPLVGYAAVANELPALAWLLFALVFVWTPVHFWALAILIKDDYADAGVPMLPVVKGDRYTVQQIGLYAVVTILLSLAPLLLGVGWLYALAAGALNLVLVRGCVRLYRQIDRSRASALFHYSMVYLALLFVALAMDLSGVPIWVVLLLIGASIGAWFWFKTRKSAAPGPLKPGLS